MCGVFIAVSKSSVVLDTDRCRKVLRGLTHRGPDHYFDFVRSDGRLYMGQTILSITGNPDQALARYHTSSSGRFNLVLNGEIYNHKELAGQYAAFPASQTSSDAETLVNLFGCASANDIASRLRGMYAFGVHDQMQNCLYVYRDLVGEKCLYFYEDDSVLVYSSEISAIVDYLGEAVVDRTQVQNYFFTRHLLSPEQTLYQGIKVFPKGTVIRINLQTGQRATVYEETLKDLVDPEYAQELAALSEDELLECLDALCDENARFLKPSIDYASVFSGGVDSSLASWYMAKSAGAEPWLVTLQFGNKDIVSKSVDKFEKVLERPVNALNIDVDRFTSSMKRFYADYRIMMATHSFVSQMILSEYVSANGFKVLIGGDGADELFGGYEHYKKLSEISGLPHENPSPYSGFVDSDLVFEGHDKSHLRDLKKSEWDEALQVYSHIEDEQARMVQAVTFLDSLIEMETVGLRSSDLMSMANSVESRSFFVTRKMLKFALNLPAHRKINFSARKPIMVTKPLLKKLFVSKFGENLLFEKQGYSGYPNDSAARIIGTEYMHLPDMLGLNRHAFEAGLRSAALDWKFLNSELFLRSVYGS